MIEMLNEVWNSLVDEVKVVKSCYLELETATTTTNDRLNDGLSTVLDRVDKLETKYRSLCNLYDDVRTIINAQERKISDLNNKVNFYSQDLIKLKGEKYEKIEDRFEALEQRITGQDEQIKILLTRLAEVEEGCCRCGGNTSKVISCYCFVRSTKLTRDVGTQSRDGDRRIGVFGQRGGGLLPLLNC